MSRIQFFGSQVGGKSVTALSYTDSPLQLLRHDIVAALGLYLFLPFLIWPLSPHKSRELCELYPSWWNMWCMFLHLLLFLLQAPFLLSIPFWFFFPLGWVVAGVGLFLVVNRFICFLLNGSKMLLHSNQAYAAAKAEHAHEQWIFLNGVAVGQHWLQSNIDRLALTFWRPILGLHNPTAGILFDVLQCLIQRNFNYATQDVRDGYKIVKEALYESKLTKVVFILHSQGAIEGGMIIDWLLQEVPQDLLAKLEVYTFGNAANHFNNPHLHLLSQRAALTRPTTAATTRITAQVHYHDIAPPRPATPHPHPQSQSSSSRTIQNGATSTSRASTTSTTSTPSGKTLHHIEHYAVTSDPVARWGVLYFTRNPSALAPPYSARFMGRVFSRAGEGHQLNQHYLDRMFPLKPSTEGENGGIGGSGFDGADEEGNEFMEEIVEFGRGRGDGEEGDEREGGQVSYLGAHGEPLGHRERERERQVLMSDESPVSSIMMANGLSDGRDGNEGIVPLKVRDLSRLWLYVNGNSPKADEVDVGIARMATI